MAETSVNRMAALREFSLILQGYACFEALYCGIKFDIFTLLAESGELSQKEIQKALKLNEHPLRVLLMSLVALGLIAREGDRYFNSPVAHVYLSRTSPKNLLAVIEAHHEIVYQPMHQLYQSLQKGKNKGLEFFSGKGKTLYARLKHVPKKEKIFHQWMKNIGSEIDVERTCFPLIADQLGKLSHVIDVGGGDGANAVILCRMFPNLKVTVFDLPSICKLARKNLRNSPYADRISFKAGDFFKDELPLRADGIFFSHIFNIYSEQKNVALLKKAYRALKPGGSVIVFNSVVINQNEPSVSAAHLSMYFTALATGEGMIYPVDDYDRWFAQAKFRNLRKVLMPNYQKAFVIGTKGAKA